MPDRSDPQPPKHDPRTCQPCGIYRHPAQAKQGRALTRHLAEHPFPRQTVTQ
ncbi:hypothetical protein ACFZC6_01920 [Streptomyces ossamyceticus]|uniref:hypothetical protein n=1 Tax=Streptomyces ossamyceticus TaxID=249581 RepID=UPI0036E88887